MPSVDINGPADNDRFALIRQQLFTAVIGDVLDRLGHIHQFLPPDIRPITPGIVIVGRAMPVLIADVFGTPTQPFGKLTEALDQLRHGEVYLARSATIPCAAWGEILTATARKRGGAGAVIDGYHRDSTRVLEQNWPVFSRGAYAQDAAPRSKVLDCRVPVQIGQVSVQSGDLVVADSDGVLIIPQNVENEVLELALEKVSKENLVRKEIESGMTSTEAFRRYGVL